MDENSTPTQSERMANQPGQSNTARVDIDSGPVEQVILPEAEAQFDPQLALKRLEQLEVEFSDRWRGVTRDLAELRHGTAGEFRSSLTDQDVADVIESQLTRFIPEDIETVLEAFEPELRSEAQRVIALISSSAEISGLEDIMHEIKPLDSDQTFRASPLTMASSNRSVVEDLLGYLADRKEVFAKPTLTSHGFGAHEPQIAIFEPGMVDRIAKRENFAQSIVDQQIEIIDIVPLREGISLFAIAGPKDLFETTSYILEQVQELRSEEQHSESSLEEALEIILTEEAREALQQLDDKHDLGGRLLERYRPVGLEIPDLDLDGICDFLNGPLGAPQEEITELMEKFPEPYLPYARELLVQLTEAYSATRTTRELRQMHQQVLEIADSRDIPEENIFVVIPEDRKSWGLMAFAYSTANQMPLESIVTVGDDSLEELPPNSILVLPDDLAGSGESLSAQAVKILATSRFSGEVIVAPLVATEESVDPSGVLGGLAAAKDRIHLVTGTTTSSLFGSDFYKGGSDIDRAIIDLVVGDHGYRGTGLMTFFPHNGPDNLCGVGELLADKLILSKRALNSQVEYEEADGRARLENTWGMDLGEETEMYAHFRNSLLEPEEADVAEVLEHIETRLNHPEELDIDHLKEFNLLLTRVFELTRDQPEFREEFEEYAVKTSTSLKAEATQIISGLILRQIKPAEPGSETAPEVNIDELIEFARELFIYSELKELGSSEFGPHVTSWIEQQQSQAEGKLEDILAAEAADDRALLDVVDSIVELDEIDYIILLRSGLLTPESAAAVYEYMLDSGVLEGYATSKQEALVIDRDGLADSRFVGRIAEVYQSLHSAAFYFGSPEMKEDAQRLGEMILDAVDRQITEVEEKLEANDAAQFADAKYWIRYSGSDLLNDTLPSDFDQFIDRARAIQRKISEISL